MSNKRHCGWKQRVIREQKIFSERKGKDLIEILSFQPIDENYLDNWSCEFKGPQDSFLEKETFTIHIALSQNYPSEPPSIKFVNRSVYHPNVDLETGNVCMSLLRSEQWSCGLSLFSIIQAVRSLLLDPYPESPFNVEAASIYTDNMEAYQKRVMYFWNQDSTKPKETKSELC